MQYGKIITVAAILTAFFCVAMCPAAKRLGEGFVEPVFAVVKSESDHNRADDAVAAAALAGVQPYGVDAGRHRFKTHQRCCVEVLPAETLILSTIRLIL